MESVNKNENSIYLANIGLLEWQMRSSVLSNCLSVIPIPTEFPECIVHQLTESNKAFRGQVGKHGFEQDGIFFLSPPPHLTK